MNKKFSSIKALWLPLSMLFITSVTLTFSFFNMTIDYIVSDFNGTVGISTYFQCGNGSEKNPYVITRPRHLYNLSRLQELGAFSGEKNYFKVGLEKDGVDYVYGSDDINATLDKKVIDMSDYAGEDARLVFHPIGSHLTPFMSEFDGSNIIIDNLSVIGENDDVGVFGYCDSASVIQNIAFTNLAIHSKGYSTNYSEPYESTFSDSLTYNDTTISDTSQSILDAKNNYTIGDNLFDSINITLPENTTDTKFIAKSANRLLLQDSANKTKFDINRASIDTTGENGFLSNIKDGVLSNSVRDQIYIIAQSEDKDGIVYSHVIDSYSVSIVNNMTFTNDVYTNDLSLTITKDNSKDEEFKISPSHKNNVGLIIGHLDGSLTKAQVYNGQIFVNEKSELHKAIIQESDFGTVGQVGLNVASNELDPSSLAKSDTGYIFTDELVELCKGTNFKLDNIQTESVFYHPTSTFAKYWNDSSNQYYTIFSAVLKYIFTESDGTKHIYGASSKAGNNVIFKRNYLIKGGLNTPLGIFDIVTTNLKNDGTTADEPDKDYTDLFTTNNVNSSPTAGLAFGEHSLSNIKYLYVADEFRNNSNLDYTCKLNDTTERSYTNINTSDQYSANYDEKGHPKKVHLYQFTPNSTSDKLYFNNTQIKYLKDSLDNTLVDENGAQIPSTREDYGISLKKYDYTNETQENITTIKYMNKVSGMIKGNLNSTKPIVSSSMDSSNKITNVYSDKEYVSGTLRFSLKRPGNVTVAIPYRDNEKFDGEYKPYLTICKQYQDTAKTKLTTSTNNPVAAMPYPSTNEKNSNGKIQYYDTNNKQQFCDLNNCMFVHTFKLEAGDYFVSTNGDSSIYSNNISIAYSYLSVEGQEVGRLSGTSTSFMQTSYADVSFLLYDPKDHYEYLFDDDAKLLICVFLLKFSDLECASEEVPSISFTGKNKDTLFVDYPIDGRLLEFSGQNPENRIKPLTINNRATAEYNPTYKYGA